MFFYGYLMDIEVFITSLPWLQVAIIVIPEEFHGSDPYPRQLECRGQSE